MSAGFLALGDSYTIGEGVEPHDRWPVQLAALLRRRGVAVGDPRIIARTGWTTAELAAAIERESPAANFGLVSLLIGVNDQYAGATPEQYHAEFSRVLNRAIGLAGGHASRVVVLSIPDWGSTPFARAHGRDREGVAREIAAFNAVNAAEAARCDAAYVDVTPSSRDAGRDPGLLVADGLHPSARMYATWASRAVGAAAAALGGRADATERA